jgi:hypothetical protein
MGMRAAILAAVLLPVACAHVEVADMGNGAHALTAIASSGGPSGAHEEALELANDYCGKSHQTADIESFDDKPDVGPLGEHTSRIVFTCSAPKDLDF